MRSGKMPSLPPGNRVDVSLTVFTPIIRCFATPIYLLELGDICFMEYRGILKQVGCGAKFLPGNGSISKERL